MEITFTVKITEEGIPQLMGLLAKMWDNPRPSDQIQVQHGTQGKTVTVHVDSPAAVPQQTAPAAAPAEAPTVPAAAPQRAAPATPVTAAQIQAAAGAFMDAAPGNMKVLQDLLAEQGVVALPQLNQEQLQGFAARLREHGVAV